MEGEVQVGSGIRLLYKSCTSPWAPVGPQLMSKPGEGGSAKARQHSEQGALVALMDLNISPSLQGYITMSVLQQVRTSPECGKNYPSHGKMPTMSGNFHPWGIKKEGAPLKEFLYQEDILNSSVLFQTSRRKIRKHTFNLNVALQTTYFFLKN